MRFDLDGNLTNSDAQISWLGGDYAYSDATGVARGTLIPRERSSPTNGITVRAGQKIAALLGSANRDPQEFADADRFDVTRDPNPHLGFGFGTHFCLGASLARFELGLLFGELARRITDLRVVDEAVLEPNIFATGVRSFTLGFTWR